jgi:hypothetical protein
VEFILTDWTRMGKVYCLAGAVADRGGWKFVRPLQVRHRDSPIRNTGWSPFLLDGRHGRWEVFDLVGAEPASPEAPHLEDLWVRGMRPRKRLAVVSQRRAILEAGTRPAGHPLFGARLLGTRCSAYLLPGSGDRSLGTFVVSAEKLSFRCAQRTGAGEMDCRVMLHVPGLEGRTLPVKDHFLLQRAEHAGPAPQTRQAELERAVAAMGETLAVRLGLSRPFAAEPGPSCAGHCWLMADGFFSLTNPQP